MQAPEQRPAAADHQEVAVVPQASAGGLAESPGGGVALAFRGRCVSRSSASLPLTSCVWTACQSSRRYDPPLLCVRADRGDAGAGRQVLRTHKMRDAFCGRRGVGGHRRGLSRARQEPVRRRARPARDQEGQVRPAPAAEAEWERPDRPGPSSPPQAARRALPGRRRPPSPPSPRCRSSPKPPSAC